MKYAGPVLRGDSTSGAGCSIPEGSPAVAACAEAGAERVRWVGRMASRPGGKNKDAARVGHPEKVVVWAQVAERLMAADCKSAAPCELRRFESSPVHQKNSY
jgi:hypothetical protein